MTHPFRERGAHPFPVWICYLVIAAGMGILLWFEIGKPTLSADPVLQPIITMTLTRRCSCVSCSGAATGYSTP